MKGRMPLYGRVLLFVCLNLIVGVLLIGWILQDYYGLGKDDLIANTVERRMEGMARLLIPALDGVEMSQWDRILEETGETHGVELAVYRPNASRRHAGIDRELPDELVQFLKKRFPPPPSGPRDRPRRGPRQGGDDPLDDLLRGEGPGPPRGRPDGPNGERPRRSPARAGQVRVEALGRYGSPEQEMAAVHIWIKPRQNVPNDLMLIIWKTDGPSQVFFSWKPLLYGVIGLLVFTTVLWVPFVYRITRRLGILTRGAESISEGDFQIDVASDRGDELGRLSRSVQRMSTRLDEYVTGQKRFLGDIAHELCSPLVRIRMGLGVLEHQLAKEDYTKLENISDEVEELSQLVNELLDFSKASMKPDTLELEDVDMHELCHYIISREAAEEGVQVQVQGGLRIKSRRDLLRRAVGNIVRNAIRYAGTSTPIVLSVKQEGEGVCIRVDDSGPGLPEEWLEKVFEPFSRPEQARTREGGGSGLGLAIAKTCITSLGGKIYCENRDEGGLGVVIKLPAAILK